MPDQTSQTPPDETSREEQPQQPSPDNAGTTQGPAPQQQRFQQRRPQGRQGQQNRGQRQEPAAQGGAQPQQGGRQERQRGQQQGIQISVVIPLYNEEGSLKELHQQLRATLGRMNVRYELLFVDDGSTDRSFQVLRDLKRFDHHVKIVRFRRNYGKSAALSVAFEKAQGDTVITMDADLQDDPAEIPGLYKKLNEGYDLVSGWKKVRRDPITKTIPSRFFNFITSIMTGIRLHDFNCGLKAYKREVIKTVKVYGELHRYVPVLAHWEGFRIGEMIVQHRPRKYGRTKFGMGRFWKGFLDLATVLFTTRYFRRPLHLFGLWGVLSVLAGIFIVVWLVVEWFTGQTALGNRPLFLGGILLIIVGIQIVSIGLLGEMISKSKQAEEQYAIREYIR
jgi:glycosyltransferase involved in cell wall biosynthesis